MLPRATALFALTAGLVAPAAAHAQSNEYFVYPRRSDPMAFDLQLFEPSTSPNSITTVDLGTVPGHLAFTIGLWSNYASRPLVVQNFVDGMPVGDSQAIVEHIWQSELHASLGLFEWMEFGLALPVVNTNHVGVVETGDPTTRALDLSQGAMLSSDFRAGDLRAYVKVPILRGAWPIAVRIGATFPLQDDRAFSSNIAWTFTPMIMASHTFGPLTAAVNLGYRWRERNGIAGYAPFVLDDEIVYSAGVRYAVHPRFGVNAELVGRFGTSDGAPQANRNPIEILAGGVINVTNSLSIQIGGGRGITSGYGAPEWRAYLGARFTAVQTRCTTGPEDYDGFQDGDYCGDPDNDQDGVPDVRDRCPNDPEDRDGYLDDDGCPDPDNDADGVLDPDDRCPMDPEDHDGYEDNDGCPEGDNDHDGVPDAVDQCPMEPEDLDGYQDDDGCPEPGPEAVVVTRTETHLLLSQRVFFDYNSDTIRAVSLPILNEVARTLRANPDITRIRIEGYTDGAGDPSYNLDLSYRRSRAVVEYLTTQGIAREHLEFQGYGSSHPVADDHTPEGQALNRRVEFTILGQGGQTAPSSNGSQHPPRRHRGH